MSHAQLNCSERFRAFTIIELLVVISIISLLMSLLLPVLSRSRDAARDSQCLSNMRQLGIGLNMYSTDANNSIPLYYGPRNSSAYTPQAFEMWVPWPSVPANPYQMITSTNEWYLFYLNYLEPSTGNFATDRSIWLVGQRIPIFDCPSTGGFTNFGVGGTFRRSFDYRRIAHYRFYGNAGTNQQSRPSTGFATNREITRVDDLNPNAMILVDGLAKFTPAGTATDNATVAEHRKFGQPMFSTVNTSLYYLSTTNAPNYGLPTLAGTAQTWQLTGLADNQAGGTAAMAGLHHNRGSNVLFPDGRARQFPINYIHPNFETATTLADFPQLRHRRLAQ